MYSNDPSGSVKSGMYGVAGGMFAPDERSLFVELLVAITKHFSKIKVDWLILINVNDTNTN